MLTIQQQEEFQQRGFIVLPCVFPRAVANAAANAIWDYLETNRGVKRDDRSSWRIPGPWLGLKSLRESEPFRALQSSQLEAAIDELLGGLPWTRLSHWGGFLVSFPDVSTEDWTLPTSGWHVDFQLTHNADSPFGVQTFVYLTDVLPRGGGTLVMEGSHRLVERFVGTLDKDDLRQKYKTLLHRFYASDPWLTAFNSGQPLKPEKANALMQCEHLIDGVSVRLSELCADAGDVILAHPWLVHMVAANAGKGPRFVLHRNVHTRVPADLAGQDALK